MSRTRIDPSLLNNLSSNLNMGSNKINSLANGTVTTDATAYGQLTNTNGAFVTDLKISWVSTTQNHLFWDDILLLDSNNNAVRKTSFEFGNTLNITTSGVNGLDTGSVAASTWYYVWAISDGTNFKGLYSLSATSPTLPGGYTYELLVGVVQTDGSANLIQTLQIGKHVQFGAGVQFLSDTTHHNVAETAVITSYVPPILAWSVDLYIVHSASYSTGADHEFVIYLSGINPTAPAQVFQQKMYAAATCVVSTTYSVLTANEPPSDVEIFWEVDEDTTNQTAYHTFGFILGYTITTLPIYD